MKWEGATKVCHKSFSEITLIRLSAEALSCLRVGFTPHTWLLTRSHRLRMLTDPTCEKIERDNCDSPGVRSSKEGFALLINVEGLR